MSNEVTSIRIVNRTLRRLKTTQSIVYENGRKCLQVEIEEVDIVPQPAETVVDAVMSEYSAQHPD